MGGGAHAVARARRRAALSANSEPRPRPLPRRSPIVVGHATDRRDRDPRLQRGARAGGERPPACTASSPRPPSPTRGGSSSPTTPATTAPPAICRRLAAEMPARHLRPPAREGPRPRPAPGLVDAATPTSSPTWTSTSRPGWRRCCRWSRRWSPATATWRSGRGWRTARGSSAGPSASSSRAPTTASSTSPCGPASATPSAASRRAAPRPSRRCCRGSRTRPGSSTPSCWPLAERAGLRIHEVPVDWVDDPDSSVAIVRTAVDDLRGIARLSREIYGELARFAAVGVASTVLYLLLFLGLRGAAAGAGGERRRAGAERDRQHRRQPPLHLRPPRRRAAAAPPRPGPARLRPLPRPDQRLPGGAGSARPRRPARRSSSAS